VHLLTSNNDGESITNFDRITIHKIRQIARIKFIERLKIKKDKAKTEVKQE
jgi:hypothetical protein